MVGQFLVIAKYQAVSATVTRGSGVPGPQTALAVGEVLVTRSVCRSGAYPVATRLFRHLAAQTGQCG